MSESKTVVDERKDRIEQIRHRLKATTFGERWFHWLSESAGWTIQIPTGWLFKQSDKATAADAEFIAKAPQDIEFLLAEVDRLASSSTVIERGAALPASSGTTGWQAEIQALIDKWRATANHNVDPGYLNDCADDLEAVVKAESCR
jgi:hypothetical protein